MRLSLKKPLVALLISLMVLPTWLGAEMIGATRAKAATPTKLVEWNFPTVGGDAIADSGLTVNSSRTISTETGGTGARTISYTAGATTDAASSDHWKDGVGNKYWQVSFNTVGYETIAVSSKQKSSNTGPKQFKTQYSVDNFFWNDFGSTISVSNTWGTAVVATAPGVTANKTDVYVRWVMDSNLAVDGGDIANTGTSSIDDIVVTGNSFSADTTPPVIAPHDDVIMEATDSSSAVVTYAAPIATDNIDPDAPADCLPASGSVFPLGTTVVECNKTDAAGNHATPTYFNVSVEDTIAPTVTGVNDGWYYAGPVTPVFTDATVATATLNGADFESGTIITELGAYDLIVRDTADNETEVHFWVTDNKATYEVTATPQDIVSPDGQLKLVGISTNSGVGTITIERIHGVPTTGGLSIGVAGFYYDISYTGDIKFPVQVELSYSDEATDLVNYLNESQFTGLYYFDIATLSWKDYRLDTPAPSTVSIDTVANKISATLYHFTPIVPTELAVPVVKNIVVSGRTISFEWAKIANADHYNVYLKNKANGLVTKTDTVSDQKFISVDGDTYKYQNNVASYGEYYIVVTAVDAFGNETAIPTSGQTFVSVPAPEAVVTSVVVETPAPAVSATVGPSRAQAATPSVATPNDNSGKIKGDENASTDEDGKVNWTPWIVLFILIILAGAATGGYFYWFGGDDDKKEETKPAKPAPKKVAPVIKEEVKTTVRNKKNPDKKAKRW